MIGDNGAAERRQGAGQARERAGGRRQRARLPARAQQRAIALKGRQELLAGHQFSHQARGHPPGQQVAAERIGLLQPEQQFAGSQRVEAQAAHSPGRQARLALRRLDAGVAQFAQRRGAPGDRRQPDNLLLLRRLGPGCAVCGQALEIGDRGLEGVSRDLRLARGAPKRLSILAPDEQALRLRQPCPMQNDCHRGPAAYRCVSGYCTTVGDGGTPR